MALGDYPASQENRSMEDSRERRMLPSATSVGIHPSKSQRTQRTMIRTRMPLTKAEHAAQQFVEEMQAREFGHQV